MCNKSCKKILMVKKEKRNLLEYANRELTEEFSNAKIKTRLEEDSDSVFLKIECVEDKIKIEKKLQQIIQDTMTIEYKRDFFNKNLCVPEVQGLSYVVFFNALLAFDRDSDGYLVKKLFYPRTDFLNLDGIYNFRLGELKRRWGEICFLTNSNSKSLKNFTVYVDFIKFILGTMSKNEQGFCIDRCGEEYYLKNEKNEKIKYNTLLCGEMNNIEKLLSTLVYLSPQKVFLQENSVRNDEAKRLIREIFL